MIITYVRRRVQRNPGQTLILIVLGGIFILSLLKLNSTLAVQEKNRQEMLPSIDNPSVFSPIFRSAVL